MATVVVKVLQAKLFEEFASIQWKEKGTRDEQDRKAMTIDDLQEQGGVRDPMNDLHYYQVQPDFRIEQASHFALITHTLVLYAKSRLSLNYK
ncbi:hypothetical protein HPP92_026213 [Vanilla planifolia]|uniref:Uncharacterized protein n=1 Tax=Vanilla planifolia TaxID=51239 RepID=A0A835PFY1_VANPL|nr:hypothetical protein HPP92_026213 [Vanilla planifolia]